MNLLSIGNKIKEATQKSTELWLRVKKNSYDYCHALNMEPKDIKSLEHLNSYISVKVDNAEIMLIPKNTCGAPYNGTWIYLLQPRSKNYNIPGVGGGTTFITELGTELHQKVLKEIQNGNVEIRSGQIWP